MDEYIKHSRIRMETSSTVDSSVENVSMQSETDTYSEKNRARDLSYQNWQ